MKFIAVAFPLLLLTGCSVEEPPIPNNPGQTKHETSRALVHKHMNSLKSGLSMLDNQIDLLGKALGEKTRFQFANPASDLRVEGEGLLDLSSESEDDYAFNLTSETPIPLGPNTKLVFRGYIKNQPDGPQIVSSYIAAIHECEGKVHEFKILHQRGLAGPKDEATFTIDTTEWSRLHNTTRTDKRELRIEGQLEIRFNDETVSITGDRVAMSYPHYYLVIQDIDCKLQERGPKKKTINLSGYLDYKKRRIAEFVAGTPPHPAPGSVKYHVRFDSNGLENPRL